MNEFRKRLERFILKNRIGQPDDLKAFDWEGYRFRPEHSTGDHWIFALEA